MADNTGSGAGAGVVQDVQDVQVVHDVLAAAEVSSEGTSVHEATASPIAPSPPQDAGDDAKSVASSPAATGKRSIDDAVVVGGDKRQGDEVPPRKKARKGSAGTSSSAQDSPSPPGIPSQPTAPGIAVTGLRTSFAQPAAPGPAGVRTSFGASSQKYVTKANIDFVMHAPLTTDERSQLMTAVRDCGSRDVKSLHKRKLDWTIGPLRTEWLVGNTWLEIWESVIDKWCEAFLVDNRANIAEVGLAPSLLKTAFQTRLDVEDGKDLPSTFRQITKILLKNPETSRLRNFADAFKPDLKKQAKKQARIAAKAASAGIDTLEAPIETDRQTVGRSKDAFTPNNPADFSANPSPPSTTHSDVGQDGEPAAKQRQKELETENGDITSEDASGVDMEIDEEDFPISQAELDQRHRYFPNVPDDAIFCLTCAQAGHATASCPDLICKFCQGSHFKYECPTRQRCAKCKQLGHTKPTCPEKLAVAPGEVAIECVVCEGHDHTEINCIQLYQIYRPQPGNVKKVKSLPVFCYACGTEGHYGGDCPLADPSVPPTKMWTMSTASLYIDPNNDNLALSYRNELPPPPEVTRPVIPGRSIKPQTHVIFEESDGEGDGDFISSANSGSAHRNKGAKTSNNTPAIQIASNISFGGSANAGQANHHHHQQQQQPPKKQKGQAQIPKKSKKSGNDAQSGSKFPGGRRSRNKGPPPPPPQPASFASARGSQPPSQGSGGRGRSGGNTGRGGGGFSQLNTKRPRRARRGQGGGGGGGQS